MTYGPGIMDEQGMVMIDGRHNRSGRILQDGCEIRIGDVAILTGADAPRVRLQSGTLAAAVGRACSVANPWGGRYLDLRYIPMLINHVPQTVELITDFEVVGTQPSALEEGYVLVELIVLTGIDLSEPRLMRSGRCARRHLQGGGIGIARIITGGSLVGGRAECRPERSRIEDKLNPTRRPAEIVVVIEEVAEASGRHDLRRQADIGAKVVGGVGLRLTEAVRIRGQRGINPRLIAYPAVQIILRRDRIRCR